MIGIAAVSHSGRVRDSAVMSALGWMPGDRIAVNPTADAVLLRRDPAAQHHMDDRGLVFLPATARAQLSIDANDRVVLVATRASNLLTVYPCTIVTSLLATIHTELATPPGQSPHTTTSTRRRLPRPAQPITAAAADTRLPVVVIQPDRP